MSKHLLKLMDFSNEEIIEILDLADKLKYERAHSIPHHLLEGKKLAMIFKKNSTRTRVSFEVGMYELGGHPLFISSTTSQMSRGEPVQDTARVLSRMVDGIMIRTFEQKEVEDLAKYGTVPVINGLTDYAHPCQVLADLQTVREHKKQLEGLNLCYVGDGNNMCNSIIVGAIKTGMNVKIACPENYDPDVEIMAWAKATGRFELCRDPKAAAADADAIFTDVWASMGQEGEANERRKAFEGVYQINSDLLDVAHPGCMVQHCLPAHRGEEITEEVFESHANEIFDEAENRLHAQKALMVKLMKD